MTFNPGDFVIYVPKKQKKYYLMEVVSYDESREHTLEIRVPANKNGTLYGARKGLELNDFEPAKASDIAKYIANRINGNVSPYILYDV